MNLPTPKTPVPAPTMLSPIEDRLEFNDDNDDEDEKYYVLEPRTYSPREKSEEQASYTTVEGDAPMNARHLPQSKLCAPSMSPIVRCES